MRDLRPLLGARGGWRARGLLAVLLLAVATALVVARGLAAPAGTPSPHGDLKQDCSDCHTTADWRTVRAPMRFRHETTGFRLEGAHRDARCSQCHKTPVFSRVGTACVDCHGDPHRGSLGNGCTSCHSVVGWEMHRAMFEVHKRLPLTTLAIHRDLDCAACHGGQQREAYAATPTRCVDCHLADYRSTKSPDHVAGGFPLECEQCHGSRSTRWQPAQFQHPGAFPLTGAHLAVACATCHRNGYAGTSADCYACHRNDYLGTRDPNHQQAGFATQCQQCHSTVSWSGARSFDHAAAGFPLTGAHAATPCASCHQNGYAGTPTDCYSCHRSAYQGTTDPNHVTAGFPTTCQAC